jgi:hypothetical protein
MDSTALEIAPWRRWLLWSATPCDPFQAGGDPLSPAAQSRLVWAFLWLGVAARAVRYFLRFPLWEDECFVSYNLIDRGFVELMSPLDYHQVAPLLFLWAQLAVVKVLGFAELPLRLLAFAGGIGSLFLFRHVAGRLLTGTSLVAAMAVFAVAYPGVRYSAEAKPYGIDLFVSLLIVALAVEWWRRPAQSRWLWILAAIAPLAVGISYPAAFVGGGVSLFVAAVMIASRARAGWIAWCIFNLTLVGGFLTFYLLAAHSQGAAEAQFMGGYWKQAFPPLETPLKLPGWLLYVHASDVLAYPVGGPRYASTASLICVSIAIAVLVRTRRIGLLALVMLPAALNLLAAAMQRYPYGGHVKFAHYLAPVICMLVGLGIAALLARWQRGSGPVRIALIGVLATFALIALGTIGRDVARPYKTTSDQRARDFARWFWFNMSYGGEVACLKTDLGQDFSQRCFHELCWSATYLCNQRIYSPRHARGDAPRLDQVSANWPLRCVQFRAIDYDFDEAAYERWIDQMSARYELVGREALPFPVLDKRDRKLLTTDQVYVLKFVPKRAVAQRP